MVGRTEGDEDCVEGAKGDVVICGLCSTTNGVGI
jgi:hypothetical protein